VSGGSNSNLICCLQMTPLFFVMRILLNCCILRVVLNWFEAVSGLRINLGKSKLVPVGDVADIEDLAGLLGCKTNAYL
jgi:hypothetical protein